jgi:hypothetical protein
MAAFLWQNNVILDPEVTLIFHQQSREKMNLEIKYYNKISFAILDRVLWGILQRRLQCCEILEQNAGLLYSPHTSVFCCILHTSVPNVQAYEVDQKSNMLVSLCDNKSNDWSTHVSLTVLDNTWSGTFARYILDMTGVCSTLHTAVPKIQVMYTVFQKGDQLVSFWDNKRNDNSIHMPLTMRTWSNGDVLHAQQVWEEHGWGVSDCASDYDWPGESTNGEGGAIFVGCVACRFCDYDTMNSGWCPL